MKIVIFIEKEGKGAPRKNRRKEQLRLFNAMQLGDSFLVKKFEEFNLLKNSFYHWGRKNKKTVRTAKVAGGWRFWLVDPRVKYVPHFKIEKGIVTPPQKNLCKRREPSLDKLEIGDCTRLPKHYAKDKRPGESARQYMKIRGKKATVRTTHKGMMVWRIA